MKEAEHLAQTNTLGPVLEERPFTEAEHVVLDHFFTNTDRNIYAAKDAMPNSLWALLEGGYSRSQLSMRMRFLNIFEEMQQECEKGNLPKDEVVTVQDFAEQIQSGTTLNMDFFLSKAEQFMRKWAVQYGHDSLKDSDNVRFAVENITQFAVPPIQEARLGAYQEKSTRYVNFGREGLIVPPELAEFEPDIRAWNEYLHTNYEESKKIVSAFIAGRLDKSLFTLPAAFDRTVTAKTFDIVRYFLPATLLTSMGVVWQTREAERHISRLMSDASEEVRRIGEALLEEGKKVSPGLLSHVAVNDYQIARRNALHSLQQTLELPPVTVHAGRQDDAVSLVSVTPDLEARIAAAILFEHNSTAHSYRDYLALCLNDTKLVENVLEAYVGQRGDFDAIPRSAEVGNILFEVTVDLGAYRDLKRHRRNLFLAAPLTALNGYEYPEHVATTAELVEIKQRIDNCAAKTAELHKKIKGKYPHLAGYVTMFANKQRMLWQMDPQQFAYVVELRTTPAGHTSYRTICQKMFELAQPHMPILSTYIRVNMSSGDEGRKRQEEKTVEKLQQLGDDGSKVS